MQLDPLESRDTPSDVPWSVPTLTAYATDLDGSLIRVDAAGDGGAPRVRVTEELTGEVVADFFVFDPEFRNGVGSLVTLPRDGGDLIAVTPGVGGGPVVAVLDADGNLVASYLAPEIDPGHRAGLTFDTFRVGPDPDDFALVYSPADGSGPIRVSEPLSGDVLLTIPGGFLAPAPGDWSTGGVYVDDGVSETPPVFVILE